MNLKEKIEKFKYVIERYKDMIADNELKLNKDKDTLNTLEEQLEYLEYRECLKSATELCAVIYTDRVIINFHMAYLVNEFLIFNSKK